MNKKRLWKIGRVVVFAVILAMIFRSFLFASYVVDGKSMEPTLYDGNLLMVNKVVYEWKDIDRFDVIIFHANKKEDYVKRVIGLPGDHIEYKNDQLYVNGEKVEEEYLKPFKEELDSSLTEDFTLESVTGKQKVPEGHLFVMGDNRRKSLDSRSFGFVSAETVVGKVDIRYWPMSQAGISFKY
ncbi:signal peptidase I [Radiobacillus kanasensis]|uniref:signal peptidase I n=1 Tax=Radiobacillus kanasensis TaxID=2844358 RepID=UPI001E5AFE38|nr:signal peptidase I [Radiobacillus kanasensis]UFU00520.1 signal peptidase I [Radiobacillus kanasensis]